MVSTNEAALPYLTFGVVADSHEVAAVRRLVPSTSTATYLPRWGDLSLKVLLFAPMIFLHVAGTIERAAETTTVQAYH